MLDLAPLTATIGAEVGGVDLADDLDDAVVEEIREALLEWKVLFFRDQHRLDRTRHVAFGPSLRRPRGAPHHAERPRATRGVRHPGRWHVPRPRQLALRRHVAARAVARSILRAVQLPPLGGDTLWADMGKAYDLLDDDTKQLIEGRKATHDYASAFGRNQPPEVQEKMRAQHPTVEHPIVRTHPEYRTQDVYVNVGFTRSIVDMDDEEGRPLLQRLYRQSTIVDLQCRFRWRPGSVAFWDNRATQHIVSNDFLPAKRVMERVTIAGDKPF